jgi:hypothetical protein
MLNTTIPGDYSAMLEDDRNPPPTNLYLEHFGGLFEFI